MDKFTTRAPASLIAELNRQATQRDYPNRSEAVRDAIRDWLADDAATDGGATSDQRAPDVHLLTRLPPAALEGRHLKGAFERAGHYEAVDGEIVAVRDGTHDSDRRTLVLDDETVVPVAGLLAYDLSAARGGADV